MTNENRSHNNGNNTNTNSTTSATTKTTAISTAANTTINSTVATTSISTSINVDNFVFNQSKGKQNFETIEVTKRRKTTIGQRDQTKHPKLIKKFLKKALIRKGNIFSLLNYTTEIKDGLQDTMSKILKTSMSIVTFLQQHTTSIIMAKPIDTTNPDTSNIHNSNRNKN